MIVLPNQSPPPNLPCFLCHKRILDYRQARGVETPASARLMAHSTCIEMLTWLELVARYHDAIQQRLIHEQGGLV